MPMILHLPNGRRIALRQGDITTFAPDAMGNAANSGLRGGGGVDGAIHRAAGPALMAACRKIGGCPTGSAVITPAGNLRARYVIHAVGPVWKGGNHGEARLLASAYRTAMQLADQAACRTLALPSLSTGVYGYPLQPAARIALTTVWEFLHSQARSLEEIYWVLFDGRTYGVYREALENLAREQGVDPPTTAPGRGAQE